MKREGGLSWEKTNVTTYHIPDTRPNTEYIVAVSAESNLEQMLSSGMIWADCVHDAEKGELYTGIVWCFNRDKIFRKVAFVVIRVILPNKSQTTHIRFQQVWNQNLGFNQ